MRNARIAGYSLVVSLTLAIASRAAFAGEAAPERMAWGTKDRILTHVGFMDFLPGDPTIGYATTSSSDAAGFGIHSTSGGGPLYATVRVPSGALLTYLELDFYDTNATAAVYLNLFDCSYRGVDCHLIDFVVSPGSGGGGLESVDLTPHAYTMDNNSRELVLVAQTTGNDATTVLNGAYVGYKLQISPAPATATFADVPTNYIYFRAIEALAASGITGGCGGGNFCPNQNVTRGEIAAFLARALGLHFPN